MIPARIATVASLPLTPNGKIDREALRVLEPERVNQTERPSPTTGNRPAVAPARASPPDAQALSLHVPPRTPLEEHLAEIWRDLLKVDHIGMHDNFFELGGHSLLATQVVARVRKQLQVEMKLSTIFEVPTINGLANNLEILRHSTQKDPALSPHPKVKRSQVIL